MTINRKEYLEKSTDNLIEMLYYMTQEVAQSDKMEKIVEPLNITNSILDSLNKINKFGVSIYPIESGGMDERNTEDNSSGTGDGTRKLPS